MATKGVTDRQRVAKSVAASARAHSQQVGERLREILTPALEEGETLPDLSAFLHVLARYLEMRSDAIIAAEEAHVEELDDDIEPRRRRDEAAAALSRTLVDIREALAGVFGRDTIKELVGLEGNTASEPVLLLRQANRVLERLQQPLVGLPATKLDGIQVDLDSLAAHLQPALDNLTRAAQEVDRELRETEASLLDKDQSLDRVDEAISGIGRIVIGFDLLAGFPDYADKVRLTVPARRRRNREEEEAPPDPESSPDPETPPDGELPQAIDFSVAREESDGP